MRSLDTREIERVSGGRSRIDIAALDRVFRRAAQRNLRLTRIVTAGNVRRQAAAQRPR